MDRPTGSPQVIVKTEEQPNSVIFTYFHGDISSMVDEHFFRALGKASKTKAPSGKSKNLCKSVKSESASASCQWGVLSPSWSDSRFDPVLSGCLQLNSTKEPRSSHPLTLGSQDQSASWSFGPMQHESLGLSTTTYQQAMSPGGLGVAGQQYTNSLLNLLHSDRSETVVGGASGIKPELSTGWTGHPGFRDPMNPDSGIVLEKKDMYWY
ncbi:hypothetical protein DPEC_G00028970 [Dallia pectoralis]|uniref:Uncharacterized protein n=1 Tax=Dallia pectoralis TaxID=75939 RepID=A0ACC2HJ05_DALPE|nr:hypothetical protein DPEC_G00028970 [Dallia pectoralis]